MTPRDGKRYVNGGREVVSATVTYRRDDGQMIVTRVGEGSTAKAALEHADQQLPAGIWTRISVSNENAIYADLKRRLSNSANRASNRGEGVTVEVTKPQVRRVAT